MAGEHHPRMSNNLAIPDINSRFVSLPGAQAVETLGLNVSVMAFHSTPNTLVNCSAYLIVHDDCSSQKRFCNALLHRLVASLPFLQLKTY